MEKPTSTIIITTSKFMELLLQINCSRNQLSEQQH